MSGEPMSLHGFMPHGMCYLWRTDILVMHVLADALIALAYFSISIVLFLFAHKRPDLIYRPVLRLFAGFIILCGVTHGFSIVTVWTPLYEIEGGLKMMAAVVSVATAIVLWPLLPRALALPSAEVLEQTNAELKDEVTRRRQAENRLLGLTQSLERRVSRRTEELARANSALRQFASTASHDLQAPLRHIRVFTALMKREEGEGLSESALDYLERIEGSAERMHTLITVLLDYAHLMNSPPNVQTMDLDEVLDRALTDMTMELEAESAQIRRGPLPAVQADPVLLGQVFRNLISNALKYRGDADPIITISADSDDLQAQITVTDNGPGIAEKYAQTVFEMLQRLQSEADTPGNGVGLAFCKQIIESHGGRIWLDTAHTDGARFVFTLPVSEDEVYTFTETD